MVRLHFPIFQIPTKRVCTSSSYAPSYEECFHSAKPVITRKDIYHDGWTDLNKNGKKDVYEDSTQPVEKRIDDLISQMTLEEKTCQMATLYGYQRVLKDYLPTKTWRRRFGRTAWRTLTKTSRAIRISKKCAGRRLHLAGIETRMGAQ